MAIWSVPDRQRCPPTRLLILDEPEQRLDPDARRRLAEPLIGEKKDGVAVLLATHQADLAEAALGDQALCEISRSTGGDEYDGAPSYAVDARVGGVLALVNAGGDKATGISVAARAAQRIRVGLYGADGQGVSPSRSGQS
ncbi:AAA family ATPase [Streptomyces inhibens]|uniref:AAA family ATPase n=1 Tax=Streptomyces inhibens TaxID=2293571 RepID=UPI00402A64FA